MNNGHKVFMTIYIPTDRLQFASSNLTIAQQQAAEKRSTPPL